jgi:hypothetical protein
LVLQPAKQGTASPPTNHRSPLDDLAVPFHHDVAGNPLVSLEGKQAIGVDGVI